MDIYNFRGKISERIAALPESAVSQELFIICCAREIESLSGIFGWDDSTALECTNLDETVRYTGYDGYDFISLIHAEMENGRPVQREVNLFFAKKHLVLVMPDIRGTRLALMEDAMKKSVITAAGRQSPLVYLYFSVFNILTADYSETLEQLEDEIEALSERIVEKPCHSQMAEISALRKTTYTFRKLLRAMSYIGGQILMDENKLLGGGNTHFFRNIDTRLIKQYDFAENLNDLSHDLLHTYDSKFSAQMNETVNKLAAITLIFGPLTVIAGIYGMNFVHMPELNWRFGYPLALAVMAVVGFVIYFIMKRKEWL